ncbi:hypothetical protein DV737_g5378, partial [Chaetothyriales sp. CBS 132003]
MADVSPTRLYLGNLPRNTTKQDIEEHFSTHGAGTIKEIKLMSGFGFIEYEDAMDAKDVVPDGSDFKGERLTVQFARGPRRKDDFGPSERTIPRPRRTIYRMNISGLSGDTSWQDLKDFARQSGQLDVVYSETGRDREGKGYGFVEFETSEDLKSAVEKLDNREFKGNTVHCTPDIQEERPDTRQYRQRSPPRGRYYDDYDRRGPPPPAARGWSPRGYGRERSPGRRPPPPVDDYYDRGYPRRSPPRGEYGPPPRRYDADPYTAPPPRGYLAEPYPRSSSDPYGRPRSPPRYGYEGGGYGGYDRRY